MGQLCVRKRGTIAVTAALAIAGLFSNAILSGSDAENTIIASNLARARMEMIKNMDYSSVAAVAKSDVSGRYPPFRYDVQVTEPYPDLKKATVTVYWASKGGEAQVSLDSYVSKN